MSFNRKQFKRKESLPEGSEPKVKVITKVVQDGITFDSKLELYVYNLLKSNNIPFELKRKYDLLPTFSYCGETVMAITLTVDFFLTDHNIILDPKGFQHGDNHLKWKLLKAHLLNSGQDPRICFVYSQKAANAFIEQLDTGFKDEIKDKYIKGRVKKLKKVYSLVGGSFLDRFGKEVCSVSELNTMPDYDLYKILIA
jgi:hypothetical protein